MKVYNKPSFITGIVLNANYTSSALQLWEMFGYSIQAVITGTPTGTFKLQGSADPVSTAIMNPAVVPVHWTDIDDSSVVISAAGSILWSISDAMYNWVRVVYTDGSSGISTATMVATFNGKGV